MRLRIGIALAATALLAAPAAAAMDVATFLAKADALKAKGPFALFSSDLRLLKAEMTVASQQLKAEKAARDKAGLPPRTCPPKSAKMGATEFLAELHKMPATDQRTTSIKDGLVWVGLRKYPCR